jgi:hypothetical protein
LWGFNGSPLFPLKVSSIPSIQVELKLEDELNELELLLDTDELDIDELDELELDIEVELELNELE